MLTPLTTNVPYHIETNQLICIANELNVSYMMGTWVVNGLRNKVIYIISYILTCLPQIEVSLGWNPNWIISEAFMQWSTWKFLAKNKQDKVWCGVPSSISNFTALINSWSYMSFWEKSPFPKPQSLFRDTFSIKR